MPNSPGTNAVERFGIINMDYIYTFLKTEWINYQGMNNVLLYDSGIYGQKGSSTPISSTTTVTSSTSSADTIVNSASNGTFNGASFTQNGELASTTGNPPTRGEFYIVRNLGTDGWSRNAIRPFAFPGSAQNNSFLSPGAMWIGDTPQRRGIWLSKNSTVNTTIASICGLPLPTSNPTIPGGGGTYNEQVVNYITLPSNTDLNFNSNADIEENDQGSGTGDLSPTANN